MPEISAFELAHRISVAKPEPADAGAAKAAFMASGDSASESIENERAHSLVGAMRMARSASGEGVPNSALVYASSFVLAATSDEERADIGDALVARHMLSLASHRDADGEAFDLKGAAQSGRIPEGREGEVRDSVFNASHLDDGQLTALSGHPLFSPPSEEHEMFASKVLSSDPASLGDDPLAFRASLAVQSLDVDPSGPDASRLASSLARLAQDGVGTESTIPDLAVRVASDVAAQARAERLSGDLGMDETSVEAFRIHEAAAQDPLMAEDLRKEAKGLFHEMSRGSMIEMRSDMETGDNLPGDMVRFIRLSAERLETINRDALDRTPLSQEASKETARIPVRGPEHEMGI